MARPRKSSLVAAVAPVPALTFHHFGTSFTFATAAQLLACVERAVARGTMVSEGMDYDITLRWLATLLEGRSDWIPAAGHALWTVARSSPQGAEAAADVLASARAGALLVAWAERILADAGDVAVGAPSHGLVYGHGEKPPLASVVAAQHAFLAERRRLGRELVFDFDPPARFSLGGPADLDEAVAHTLEVGWLRTRDGFFGPALGWLHFEAKFVPWIAAALPAILTRLAEGDDARGHYLATEYVVQTGDRTWVGDLIERLAAQPPAWASLPAVPDATLFPRHPRPAQLKYMLGSTFADLGAALHFAAERLAFERATAPVLDA